MDGLKLTYKQTQSFELSQAALNNDLVDRNKFARYSANGNFNILGALALETKEVQTDDVNTFGALAGNGKYNGGVLAPNGVDIYAIPYGSTTTTVLKINTLNDTITTFGSLGAISGKYSGGVLAPNGFIYFIPYSATSILKIDPTNDTITTFGSIAGSSKWYGAVLAPNGFIYGIPYNSFK